jgi:hypothetical protein
MYSSTSKGELAASKAADWWLMALVNGNGVGIAVSAGRRSLRMRVRRHRLGHFRFLDFYNRH